MLAAAADRNRDIEPLTALDAVGRDDFRRVFGIEVLVQLVKLGRELLGLPGPNRRRKRAGKQWNERQPG